MLRVVVREDLTYEMASILVTDIKKSIEWLDHHFIYTGASALCIITHALIMVLRVTFRIWGYSFMFALPLCCM